MKYIKYPLIILTLFMIRTGWTQACCSAGTPLLSSLEVAATAEKTWQLGLTYEYNFLDDVFSGTDEIQGTRQRISQSLLAEISYGINDRFSLTALLSFNRQTRKLRNQNSSGSLEELSTRGPGDAVFLMTYNILTSSIVSQRQLSLGTGVKAPTGTSQLKSDGFLLPADLSV